MDPLGILEAPSVLYSKGPYRLPLYKGKIDSNRP